MTSSIDVMYEEFNNCFDHNKREFKFDLKTADVRCALFRTDYVPHPFNDRFYGDIMSYEIEVEVEVAHAGPFGLGFSLPFDILKSHYGSHTETHLLNNGYDGPQPCGMPLTTSKGEYSETEKAPDAHGGPEHDVKYEWFTTMLKVPNLEAAWGHTRMEKDKDGVMRQKFPDGATFHVGTIVYFLNRDNDPHKSPLMTFEYSKGGWVAHQGNFSVQHNHRGSAIMFTPKPGTDRLKRPKRSVEQDRPDVRKYVAEPSGGCSCN
jgi:hypothetical protein